MKQTPSDPHRYSKPELRDQIKKQVTEGDKGGKPGQWSARKAQLVAHAYEAAGGGYKEKKSAPQKSLEAWGEEKWRTEDGDKADREGGMTRYLPGASWEKLSPAERAATNRKKGDGSKHGKQFVANTQAAADARKDAIVSNSPPETYRSENSKERNCAGEASLEENCRKQRVCEEDRREITNSKAGLRRKSQLIDGTRARPKRRVHLNRGMITTVPQQPCSACSSKSLESPAPQPADTHPRASPSSTSAASSALPPHPERSPSPAPGCTTPGTRRAAV
jgi:hypothetical protein